MAITCLNELMLSNTHFNFRINILKAIIDGACCKDKQITDLCCQTISTLFKNDQSGEVSLEALRMIARVFKTKNYIVDPIILKTFLHLKVQIEIKREIKEKEKQIKKTIFNVSAFF